MENKRTILIIDGFEGDLEKPSATNVSRGSLELLQQAEIAIVINDAGDGRVVKMRNDMPDEYEVKVVSADAE